ncbi:hypothetical protein G7067_08400 [Leucobacter insecticola]|uniref:Uncharacterized protein n=1 Tax=Leucobacter insecticola TaxID=2714934 RepID=A0A6G8FJ92_9MICO|nr:hypothetical protein [Leucobacter insecticola]QIM16435.1 hypothetical protein G7067_08400 [Leucobacter insecticola]
MSEHKEQQPLTRRERRAREMGETGALDLSQSTEVPSREVSESIPAAATEAAVVVDGNDDIEISPFNDDGTPRSRREMRQLREAALAEREAARAAAIPAAVEPDPVAVEPEPEPEVVAEAEPEGAAEPEAAAEPEPVAEPIPDDNPESVSVDSDAGVAPDFDSLIAPPTEPFSVADLHEASQPSERSMLFDEPASKDAPQPVVEVPLEAEPEEESASPKSRLLPRNLSDASPGIETKKPRCLRLRQKWILSQRQILPRLTRAPTNVPQAARLLRTLRPLLVK